MARGPLTLLTIVVFWVALPTLGQSTAYPSEADVPEVWIEAPNSKANPDLWKCARDGGGVIVGLDEGSVHVSKAPDKKPEQVQLPQHLKLSKEMIGRPSAVLRTADGWLVGFDAGEFGGGLWWFNDEGDENRKLLTEPVRAIDQTPDGVFVFVGVTHLTVDSGKIYKFTEGTHEVRVLADLGGAPGVFTVDADGKFVVVTAHFDASQGWMSGVITVDEAGNVHKLYKSAESLTDPTSIIVDADGNILVGMRFFILRLIPGDSGDYRPQWLMPNECQSFKIVNRICTCGDTH